MRLYVVLTLASFCALSSAHLQYRDLLPNGKSVPCPPGDALCDESQLCEGVGHESCGGGVVTPNLNPFGRDLLKEGVEWTTKLCEKDSDGDGFSNGYELGDPCCVWKEGASVPDWMLNWPVSHPGSNESTQLPDEDIESLCKSVKPPKVLAMQGQKEVTSLDFAIEEYEIPAELTTYVDVRFNLPHRRSAMNQGDEIYYLIGGEALIDNTAMVQHYVVTACTNAVDEDLLGKAAPISEGRDKNCSSTIWIWAPRVESIQLPSVAIPVGAGVGLSGINLQIHYNNPTKIKGVTDASMLRLFFSTKPRNFEGGFLMTGSITSIGVIPPKKTVYSSTVYQVKVNSDIAPDGITVYGFLPRMHALGRKMWVEKLKLGSIDGTDLPDSLEDLVKIEDIARDDAWDVGLRAEKHVPFLKISDGDYLATTCIYNSDDKKTVTLGGRSSHEEMCLGYLAIYPANAVDTVLLYKGPTFFSELSKDIYPQVNSFLDILKLPKTNAQFPLWRRAYLNGELECRDTKPPTDLRGSAQSFGVYLAADTIKNTTSACGDVFPRVFFGIEDVMEAPPCTKECARFVYNMLGCSLVWQATSSSGDTLGLYPSFLESKAEAWCSKAFVEVYKSDRVSAK